MPKDDRLFAPFPIEMDEHPKIIGLSDAAFRALFEATFYSRRMLSDGFLDERVVLKRWGIEVADELASNDLERPSWIRVESPKPGWRIHDFEKHHPLRAEIVAKRAGVSQIRSEAGSKGAAKRWQTDSKPVANDSSETETETETESKTSKRASVQAALEREFDEFWKVYPRKEGKQAAKRKYMTVRRSFPAEVIFKGAQAYALLSLGKEKQFVKMAQGWLNDGRFEDVSGPATSPLAPRSLDPSEHSHKWLADGSCVLCTAKKDREDTW